MICAGRISQVPLTCSVLPMRKRGGFAVYLVCVRPRLPGDLAALDVLHALGRLVLVVRADEAREVGHGGVAGGGLDVGGEPDAGPEVEVTRGVGAATEAPGGLAGKAAP